MEQTKNEVLSDIMYEFNNCTFVDIEVDNESYSIDEVPDGYRIRGVHMKHDQTVPNKTELKKAIRKLGKHIVIM